MQIPVSCVLPAARIFSWDVVRERIALSVTVIAPVSKLASGMEDATLCI